MLTAIATVLLTAALLYVGYRLVFARFPNASEPEAADAHKPEAPSLECRPKSSQVKGPMVDLT